MRSPVQSRVPLLDKNKAFGRLPLLGAFFFYTSIGAGLHYGLHQRKSHINQIKHLSNSMCQGSTYKKIASTYKKLRLSKYHLKSLSIPIL